ncbi:ABC transporter substrate-binding protein [Candidimonas sp. SYP-B2681]|uniref:ABC transporter substrate-binding protein n=1 Tax=Candidimonas sp. SYP-B2681 TaxID=2497686 RepID=UPI000F87D5C9|nr:ABC transporter substrate-binding protein [Candidimonas sp. SYP-B2681]RTZ45663.1 ABC transporter substrate-binding protein [Candidimonas sp. SYP-B2681]
MKSIRKTILLSALAASFLSLSSIALARDLTIALRSEPSSMDPQFHSLTPNTQLSETLFDPIVRTDANAKPVPSLAESWTVDGNVWTFKLRPDVKFADGSPFSAEDVLFTYARVPKVPNSPSSYSLYLSSVEKVEAPDPLTVKITTKGPSPVLLPNLSMVPIMSKKAASGPAPEGKTTVELNRGDGLVGTGPYKFVSWKRGAEIIFERNEHYWGEKPAWDKVVYRPISNSAARVAALLAGDVDLIEDPPTDDLPKLKNDKNLHVQETPSVRVIYIALNQGAEVPPGMTGTSDKNPLADKRVRQALSLAIDRKAIVDRVMGGAAQTAGNLLAYPGFGTSEKLSKVALADATKAKELLTAAGYPDGFTVSLGSPAGRYTNDQRIAQVVASMWARIGVKANVETMAPPVFFKKRDSYAFSTYLAGWAASSGEMLNPLLALVHTKNPALGLGTTNWSKYSNPELDKLVVDASRTLDDAKRSEMLQQAGSIVMEDFGILPLQFELSVWAMKKDIRYGGRTDQMTLAQYMTLAK